MNYLAHFVLSDEDTLVGNFAGDFVKGKKTLEALPEDFRRGVIWHRAIDDFTDSHPVFIQSVKRVRAEFGHYAGVAVDLYYDYLLATDFVKWTGEDLSDFSQRCYSALSLEMATMPEKAQFVCERMIQYDWLASYATDKGLDRSFKGIASRTKFDSGLENGFTVLQDNEKELRADFAQFFPRILEFKKDYFK
ncbi:acyl carrier protein phosphodiesterase [Fulvitalea axinellae]